MQTLEYLDNDVKIYQDDSLYKFTSDAILLSKFAKVKNGDIVADFCSGSGIVGFNLYALNKNKINSLTFFEMQTPLYDLSKKSIEYNNLHDKLCAVNTKVQEIESCYNGRFSLIVCNPPYAKADSGEVCANTQIAVCKTEIELSLEELVLSISKRLKFGGRVNMVHRAERLADIFKEFNKNNIEPKRLQVVSAKNKTPYLVLIEGVKGGKGGIKIEKEIEN